MIARRGGKAAARLVRVLMIEDDAAARELLQIRLEAAGYGTAAAENGREGITMAAEGAYDLVLLDLQLPDVSGFEVLAVLRRLRPELPVILMTAHGSPEVAGRAVLEGATTVLAKPFGRHEVLRAIDQAVPPGPEDLDP